MTQQIFLVGLPGAGKTTIGQELALELRIPFLDLDQEIEKSAKKSIRSIFLENGEDGFRQLEYTHLRRVIRESTEYVLATGGGTPCFFDNMKVMNATGTTIFINTPIVKIKERLQQDSARPLMKTNTLEELMRKRRPWYEKADYIVDSPDQIFTILNSRS